MDFVSEEKPASEEEIADEDIPEWVIEPYVGPTPEKPVEPFGDGFKRLYQAQSGKPASALRPSATTSGNTRPSVGGNFRPVNRAIPPRPMASDANAGNLREGCRIEHQRFGIGQVIKIEGTGENTKATVEFRNAGVKQLLLKFAKFKIIG